MTKQETFNIAATGLLQQNAKSIGGIVCRYRGMTGRKCAVGMLIPDDRYSVNMEGGTVRENEFVRELMAELGHDFTLCLDLQEMHDLHPVSEWLELLGTIAKKHGLSLAVGA